MANLGVPWPLRMRSASWACFRPTRHANCVSGARAPSLPRPSPLAHLRNHPSLGELLHPICLAQGKQPGLCSQTPLGPNSCSAPPHCASSVTRAGTTVTSLPWLAYRVRPWTGTISPCPSVTTTGAPFTPKTVQV